MVTIELPITVYCKDLLGKAMHLPYTTKTQLHQSERLVETELNINNY